MSLSAQVDNHPTYTHGDLHISQKASTTVQVGAMVMIQAGYGLEAAAAASVKVAGAAKETVGGAAYDNSAGSNGAVTLVVETSDGPDGLRLFDYENDSGDPVEQTDLGTDCYIKDAKTVTMNSTGSSVAGVVHGLTSAGKVRISFKRL